MNVLNVEDVERELRRHAARLYHEPARLWMMTVARNYVLGKLTEKDINANFRELCLCKYRAILPKVANKRHAPEKHDPKSLPPWAVNALRNGEKLLWFDTEQCRRRTLWSVMEIIAMWFNNWKASDTRLRRIDRISFPVAVDAAVLWHKDVSENIWYYVTDKPSEIKRYANGFRWVRLVKALQFEREGKLLNHCVGNGNYFNNWQSGSAEYYSLRDINNKPRVTIEVTIDTSPLRKKAVRQCKGFSNSRPSDELQPFILDLLEEMKWPVIGDAHFIGVAKPSKSLFPQQTTQLVNVPVAVEVND